MRSFAQCPRGLVERLELVDAVEGVGLSCRGLRLLSPRDDTLHRSVNGSVVIAPADGLASGDRWRDGPARSLP